MHLDIRFNYSLWFYMGHSVHGYGTSVIELLSNDNAYLIPHSFCYIWLMLVSVSHFGNDYNAKLIYRCDVWTTLFQCHFDVEMLKKDVKKQQQQQQPKGFCTKELFAIYSLFAFYKESLPFLFLRVLFIINYFYV